MTKNVIALGRQARKEKKFIYFSELCYLCAFARAIIFPLSFYPQNFKYLWLGVTGISRLPLQSSKLLTYKPARVGGKGCLMEKIDDYVGRVAEHFKSQLGSSLVEVYKIGSLAHGGFSQIYSDIDVGLILDCPNPPADMDQMIAEGKALDGEYGKKLSIFWGNPEYNWGRLPALDRLDLLDHGVPLLDNRRADFRRPTKEEVRRHLNQTIEGSWRRNIDELSKLKKLEPKDRKPYIRAILYPARLIYSWDSLAMDSNDRAVEYLRNVRPPGLDLSPIERALACRQEECSAEDVFILGADLNRQFESTVAYISVR
jgi:hypothetical protein